MGLIIEGEVGRGLSLNHPIPFWAVVAHCARSLSGACSFGGGIVMQVRAVGVYGGPFHTAAGSILCLPPCSKAALLGKVRKVPQIEKKRRSERSAVLKKSFDSLFYGLGNTFFA